MGKKKTRVGRRVPVSRAALTARINRKLAKKDQILRKTREWKGEGVSRAWLDCGDYYIIDLRSNFLIEKFIGFPEDFAREIGCLAKWEKLAKEEKR